MAEMRINTEKFFDFCRAAVMDRLCWIDDCVADENYEYAAKLKEEINTYKFFLEAESEPWEFSFMEKTE